MVPLLARIDEELAGNPEPSRAASLLARKACYFARVGKFDEARQLIAVLRQAFPMGSNPRASVWIMLAEGLTHTFEDLSPEGLDRIVRAETLAVAMKDRELTALASAWLAHWKFERSEFSPMARYLRATFLNASNTDHETLARVSMVMANAFALCGNVEKAQSWYMGARFHALEAGDHATIDALLYNRAAFGVAWLRNQTCLGAPESLHLKSLRLEFSSAQNYQQLVGVASLTNQIELWVARLLMLDGKFEQAIRGLDLVRHKEPFALHNFHQSIIDLEIAYCLAKLGRTDDAAALLARYVPIDYQEFDVDERLYAIWLKCQIKGHGIQLDSADVNESDLVAAQTAVNEFLMRLRVQLDEFADIRPPEQSKMKVPGTLSRSGSKDD